MIDTGMRSGSNAQTRLTQVWHLSTEDSPELLGVWTLRVNPFLDGLHLICPAAHVLLCLDEGGQIDCLYSQNKSRLVRLALLAAFS